MLSESPSYFAPSAARSTVAPSARCGLLPGGGNTNRRARRGPDQRRPGYCDHERGRHEHRVRRFDDGRRYLHRSCRSLFDAEYGGPGGDALPSWTDTPDYYHHRPPDHNHRANDNHGAGDDDHDHDYDGPALEHFYDSADNHYDYDYDNYDDDHYNDYPGDDDHDGPDTGYAAKP